MKTRLVLMLTFFVLAYSSCNIEYDDEKLQKQESTDLRNYLNSHDFGQPNEDGLYFKLRTSGNTGAITPSDTDFVMINTTWYLLNGKLAATNDTVLAYNARINPMAFYKGPLKYYIPGCFAAIAQGVLKMKEGDSATLITPSKLMLSGYQNKSGTIPRYSPLRIELKLVRVIKDPVADDMANIKKYLDTLQLTEQDKQDGIYLKIDKEGTGELIDDYDTVNFIYTSRALDTAFSLGIKKPATMKYIEGQSTNIPLGIRTALKKLKEGLEARVIVPYDLAYGREGMFIADYDAVVVPSFTSFYFTLKVNHVGKY